MLAAVGALCMLLTAPVGAGDAPEVTVEGLHAALLAAMRDADALGFEGRRERLAPVIESSFDLDFVTMVVMGRSWAELDAAQRDQMRRVFASLTVATYAARFDGFDGESFQTGATEEARDGRRLVRSWLRKADGTRVQLDYLLQSGGGPWRIVNVVADGVSDLSLKRAEYASIMKAEGFDALLARLRAQVEDYASGRD